MLQAGYAIVPYSSLESVIEQNRDAYYFALRRTQLTIGTPSPDWQPWIDFFVQSVATQVANLEAKLDVGRIVIAAISAHSLAIIEFARNRGRVTLGARDSSDWCQSRHTQDAISIAAGERNTCAARPRARCVVRVASDAAGRVSARGEAVSGSASGATVEARTCTSSRCAAQPPSSPPRADC